MTTGLAGQNTQAGATAATNEALNNSTEDHRSEQQRDADELKKELSQERARLSGGQEIIGYDPQGNPITAYQPPAALVAPGGAIDPDATLAKYGNSASKLTHIFDDPTHDLGQLVNQYGSNNAAFEAVDSAAQQLAGRPGVVTEWINVGGTPVWVRGMTVNGSFRIGTFSGNTANPKYPLPSK